MFGIMYETEDGKVFRIFKTYEEAQTTANNIACMGFPVTVLDYNEATETYLELYTI